MGTQETVSKGSCRSPSRRSNWEQSRLMVASQGVGEVVVMQYACVACHIVPGVWAPLTAWAERYFIVGTLSNEPDNLIRWTMGAQEIEPDTAMPDVDVNEVAARDMAVCLYTLRQ